jgi:hypothetical protein
MSREFDPYKVKNRTLAYGEDVAPVKTKASIPVVWKGRRPA